MKSSGNVSPHFKNDLCRLETGRCSGRAEICLPHSTSSTPCFFPVVLSSLAHGTVNDLSCAGRPLYLSAGFILEEGFTWRELEKDHSIHGGSGREADVQVVTGDTKVVTEAPPTAFHQYRRRQGYPPSRLISPASPNRGCDHFNGPIGDHGSHRSYKGKSV